MGLRTVEGVGLDAATWRRLDAPFAGLSADGLLQRRGDRLIASPAGRRILNTVLEKLLSDEFR